MILTGQPIDEIANDGQPNTVRRGSLVARWWGTIYQLGEPIGRRSVEQLLETCTNSTSRSLRQIDAWFAPGAPARSLHGTFLLWIADQATGEQVCFIDHAGLFRAAFSEDAVALKLLPLLEASGKTLDDFDVDAAVELLTIGYVDSHRSMVRGLRFITHDQVFYWGPNGRRQTRKKNLGGLQEPPEIDFETFFERFAQTLRGETVSVDLTGGFDSRLLAALLHQAGLNFEVSMTGTEAHKDVRLARKVARTLGKDLVLYEHPAETTNEDLERFFQDLDGHLDLINFDRLHRWYKQREARGITTTISGSGGELFAEYWWLQDAPRFNAARPRLGRLYDLRMASMPMPFESFGAAAAESARTCRDRVVHSLGRHRQATNTSTYDQIFAVERMPALLGPTVTAINRGSLNLLTPLNDWDLMAIGFQLPRRQRVFRQFHRAKIEAAHPRAARCASTERVSCGYTLRAGLLDPPRYLFDKAERLTRKVIQRLRSKNWRYESPNHPQVHARIRAGSWAQTLIQELIEDTILAPEVSAENLRDGDLGRALSVALMRRRLRSP
jgi:hypothetical protein